MADKAPPDWDKVKFVGKEAVEMNENKLKAI